MHEQVPPNIIPVGPSGHPVIPTVNQFPAYQRTREMSLEDMLLENRIVFLAGPISERTASVTVMRLLPNVKWQD